MAKKEERFEVTFRDGSQLKDEGVRQILVDKETGVNYLCWNSGFGASITPLLDSEGKVIVRPIVPVASLDDFFSIISYCRPSLMVRTPAI